MWTTPYDDRYLTLVIMFMPVTLVTLFRSYNQFYRAECVTVLGFFVLIQSITWLLEASNSSNLVDTTGPKRCVKTIQEM